jgi:hypothetical protein
MNDNECEGSCEDCGHCFSEKEENKNKIVTEIEETTSHLIASPIKHTKKCSKCNYEYDHMFIQCPICHPRTCVLFPFDELINTV